MSSNTNMSWRAAIAQVLEHAEKPLDHHEIAKRILRQELRTTLGRTPAATVSSELGRMIKSGERIGREIIRRTESGFARTSVANSFVPDDQVADDPDKITCINAYGLNWERNLVNWQPSRGNLWGYQPLSSNPVDFADQDGIYLLHHGSEIVYAGRTRTARSEAGLYGRLRYHNEDVRKTGRWDAFSWFGFKPVDNDTGQLQDSPEFFPVEAVITLVETILIEGLMPRLNMRSGDDIRSARETSLFFQYENAE